MVLFFLLLPKQIIAVKGVCVTFSILRTGFQS